MYYVPIARRGSQLSHHVRSPTSWRRWGSVSCLGLGPPPRSSRREAADLRGDGFGRPIWGAFRTSSPADRSPSPSCRWGPQGIDWMSPPGHDLSLLPAARACRQGCHRPFLARPVDGLSRGRGRSLLRPAPPLRQAHVGRAPPARSSRSSVRWARGIGRCVDSADPAPRTRRCIARGVCALSLFLRPCIISAAWGVTPWAGAILRMQSCRRRESDDSDIWRGGLVPRRGAGHRRRPRAALRRRWSGRVASLSPPEVVGALLHQRAALGVGFESLLWCGRLPLEVLTKPFWPQGLPGHGA